MNLHGVAALGLVGINLGKQAVKCKAACILYGFLLIQYLSLKQMLRTCSDLQGMFSDFERDKVGKIFVIG